MCIYWEKDGSSFCFALDGRTRFKLLAKFLMLLSLRNLGSRSLNNFSRTILESSRGSQRIMIKGVNRKKRVQQLMAVTRVGKIINRLFDWRTHVILPLKNDNILGHPRDPRQCPLNTGCQLTKGFTVNYNKW